MCGYKLRIEKKIQIFMSSTISFNTTASKLAVLTYFIAAADKVLVNYVGDFGGYPQP